MNKFKYLGLKNYKNIYDWIYLDFNPTDSNKNIKNKLSLMGKNGIGKTNVMYYFHELSNYFKYSSYSAPIDSQFDISMIIEGLEFDVEGKFYENNQKETCLKLNVEFTSALSSSKNNKKYSISSDYLESTFGMEDLNLLKLKKQSFIYFILILSTKNELTPEDMSFCKLFNIKYSTKSKKITTSIEEYTNEIFHNSYAMFLINMLSKISFLEWSDVPSNGEKHTEWDRNFEVYLEFLLKHKNILKDICHQVEKLDVDVNNIRIEKETLREGYVVLFDNSQKQTLNFALCSVGTKKYFTLMTLLKYIEYHETCKLVLIDEIDSGLNNQVIKSIVQNLSDNIQFVLTHHRPSLLTNNIGIFDFDEMCFFTYESGKKEIANLTEFEEWKKYKRNNKLVFEYLENYFGTEPNI